MIKKIRIWSRYVQKREKEQQHNCSAAIRGIFETSSRNSFFFNVSEKNAKPVKKHACIRHIKTFLLAWDKLVVNQYGVYCFHQGVQFRILCNSVKCCYLLPGFSPLLSTLHTYSRPAFRQARSVCFLLEVKKKMELCNSWSS